MTFETDQFSISKVFSPDFVFEFPAYQRPFRWTVDDADALLDDLIAAEQFGKSDPAAGSYFIGSIVLTKRSDRRRAVVDGRQRLTTLFILLAVLRDLEPESARKAQLHRLLADEEDSVKRIDAGWRLRLSEIDADAVKKLVGDPEATAMAMAAEDGIPERHARYSNVAKNFRETLQGAKVDLRDLLDFVLHRCELIAVTAGSDTQGTQLFKVLNSRGVELSESDELIATLISSLPQAKRAQAAEIWDDTDARLGGKGVDTLLRSLSFILSGTWRSDAQWHKKLLEAIGRLGFDKFHDQHLGAYAETIDRIFRKELPFSDPKKNPNHFIETLGWLGRREGEWSEWLPIALELLKRAGDSEERVYAVMKALDCTMYIMFINNVGDENRRKVCREVFAELAAGKDPLHANGALTPEAHHRKAAREKLSQPFRKYNVRGALTRRAEAAAFMGSGESMPPLVDTATVEHVLPQSGQRVRVWRNDFPGNEFSSCLDLLGNAILLNRAVDNSVAASGFSAKKRAYLRYTRPSPLPSVQDVCRYESWKPNDVRNRTGVVAKTLAASLGL